MPTDPTHRCDACQTEWTQRPRPALILLGWGVIAAALAAAAAMLLLIRDGRTDLGGACAAGAMAALGLGVWLQSRALPRCPSCKRVPPPTPPEDSAEGG